jgi:8-oxo-dGTP pyrophosphatase MutT (NUDIX family)
LVLHAKLGRWLQPGGHADPVDNGSLENTALREAREETGLRVTSVDSAPIDVDVHVIPERKDEPEHRHLDVRFLLVAEQEAALAPDPDESLGAQWLSWNEALERADEAPLKRLLEKARHVTQTWTRRFDLSL